MNKNVLITGATGYLGSRILRKFLNNNFNIFVVKRETSDISGIISLSSNIKFYDNDELSIREMFQENHIDVVVHTATLYGRKGESMLQIKEANLDFPLLILKCALENNVKYFINTGTSLPYLTNQYSLFKNQFSECLEFYAFNITSINILLEHFYGTGDEDSKFITSMIGKMKCNIDKIELTEGKQLRDFIFIEDVIDAYLFIINNLARFTGYTNLPLGSGSVVTIREVVETIKRITCSKSELLFGKIPMRENELMRSDADISILKNLGWFPKFNLDEGLKIVVDSYNKIN